MLAIPLGLLSMRALAQFPSFPESDPWQHKPNDPEYKDQWHLFSHLPQDHRNPNVTNFDQKNGSGMSVDKAWQLHTGNAKMLITIMDSGIDWSREDLKNHIFLNRNELPPPEGFNHYDINNDGRISIADYASDSRVSDHNNNQLLDTEDLILSFSDGVDGDGNGFVDDISGWDFVENDNNPGDRIGFYHGTWQGIYAAAEINNGVGSAGICGNCTMMFIRTGDTFIVDSNAYAASVIYATDMGTSVVQGAVGGLSNNPYVRKAVNYAYDRNVVVVGTSADESSYHNNQPAITDPILYPNAVRYDNYQPVDATTFANFNNCSNYGPRLDVAVSAKHCSSEATANLSGIIGLARSYSEVLNKTLSAGEVVSLVKSSATDINFGSNEASPQRYSTWAGWDSITGHGRVNAWNMMKAIWERDIPPESRITSPDWFEVFRLSHVASIPIEVSIGSPRSGKYRAEIAVGRGIDIPEQNYRILKTVADIGQGFEGQIAELSPVELIALPSSDRDHPRYRNAFTIKVTLTSDKGRVVVSRRSIYIFEDKWLHKDFPRKLAGSGESSGVFVDLDQDGAEEYVTADGAGQIYAFSHASGVLPGFPAPIAPSRFALNGHLAHAAVVGPIAAGDLDGDGEVEIVAHTFEGHVSVIDRRGRTRAGFPKTIAPLRLEQAHQEQRLLPGILAAPTLADVSGNGKLEIITPTLDGHIYIFDEKGNILPGFPFAVLAGGLRAKIVSSPAVADLNDDGFSELIFGTNHYGKNSGQLVVVDGQSIRQGRPDYLPGFPVRIPMVRDEILPTIGVGVTMSPAVADIDADGELEILAHGVMGKMYAVKKNGAISHIFSAKVDKQSEVSDSYMVTGLGNPAIGRLEYDSKTLNPVGVGVGKKILTSIILGGVRYPYQHMMSAWSVLDNKMLKTFPRQTDDIMIFTTPTLADLDGDGVDELLYAGGGNYAHAMKAGGGSYEGFPHFTGGWSISAMSAGDFDGDGRLDVATATREGYLFIWRTDAVYDRRNLSWPTYQANARRTGVYSGR